MTPCSPAGRPRISRLKRWPGHLCKHAAKLLVLLIGLASPQPALANARISAICDAAADAAARATGVPLSVLQDITLSETGRKTDGAFAPWPWTVNMEGKGNWFASRAAAQTYADQHFQRGARSFDVGCFQLNYKWHGHAFASIQQMFDPNANALYAANFQRELFVEKGNWIDAAGAYHSRTPQYADRYKIRFGRILANIAPDQPASRALRVVAAPPRAQTILPSHNNFPLLQSGSTAMASLGSLMPDSAGVGARRLFGGG